MIRVSYSTDRLAGKLECEFCGTSQELPGNVRTFRDGDVEKTYPDAWLVVQSHFHEDKNSHIDVCRAVPNRPCGTEWQAVNLDTNEVVAHGRVNIIQIGSAIQMPEVIQTAPAT